MLFGPVDPWWNPAHLTLYFGVALVIVAVWRGLSNPARPTEMSPVQFVNVAGLKLAAVGSVIQIVAGVWNEIVHHIIGHEPRIAPAHALLVVGMLTINLGMVIGLSVEYEMMRREFLVATVWRRRATCIMLVMTFASIWMAGAGSFIYIAGAFHSTTFRWIVAVLLSAFAPFVLVSAKRFLPSFGTAGAIALVFNAVGYVLLVMYVGAPSFIPVGILSVLLFELLMSVLPRWLSRFHEVLFASAILGILFQATYYPYTAYLFPWSTEPQVLASLMFGGLVGGLGGWRVYGAASSIVVGDAPLVARVLRQRFDLV
jgi:hypothetical protein